MNPTKREFHLVFIATFLAVSSGTNIDFSNAFFVVIADMIGYFIMNTVLAVIVYKFMTKPLFKWLANN